MTTISGLAQMTEVLVVCAHPDDESFGLGAVLAALSSRGTRVRFLCLTHGEASTLGATGDRPLGEIREEELIAAARVLGIDQVELFAYRDGFLDEVPVEELADLVDHTVLEAEALVVFDEGGITGHVDHCHATAVALRVAVRRRLPVLAWAIPELVAAELNSEFGTTFIGRSPNELPFSIPVDRTRQRAAITCHASQSGDNPVLWRRLELLGEVEHLRWLTPERPGYRSRLRSLSLLGAWVSIPT
ncbi:MAG: PIG-L deacetylase family protein [Ferrimicrobium sp.]